MSRIAQPIDSLPARVFRSACIKASLLAAALLLAGCGVGGFSLEKAEVDRSIVTSSVASGPVSDDTNLASDQQTIRNAVSSIDVEELGGKAVPWANSDTGSRGQISELAEEKAGSVVCRRFAASRESFQGVAMYRGTACQAGSGAWQIQDFKAL